MGKLGLFILCFTSIFMVFVESQNCTKNADCESGCCYSGNCNWNNYNCASQDKIESRFNTANGESKACAYNWQCSIGFCCNNGACEKKEWYQTDCRRSYGLLCNYNSQCASGCCVEFCRREYEDVCLMKNVQTTPNAYRCTFNSECYSDCCNNNKCEESYLCTSPTEMPTRDWFDVTTRNWFRNWNLKTTEDSYDDYNNDHYNNNNYYDDYDSSGSSSHSGLSSGAYIGLAIGGATLFFVKIALWTMYCSRRRRVVVVRTRCVRRVAIVQEDHLQLERERLAAEGAPTAILPPYSPRIDPPEYTPSPTEGNVSQDTSQASAVPESGPGRGTGVQQGAALGPPPAYSPSVSTTTSQNPNVSTPQTQVSPQNPAQPDQEGVVNPIYGLPQGDTARLTLQEYARRSLRSARNVSTNATQISNPAQTDQTPSAETSINIEG